MMHVSSHLLCSLLHSTLVIMKVVCLAWQACSLQSTFSSTPTLGPGRNLGSTYLAVNVYMYLDLMHEQVWRGILDKECWAAATVLSVSLSVAFGVIDQSTWGRLHKVSLRGAQEICDSILPSHTLLCPRPLLLECTNKEVRQSFCKILSQTVESYIRFGNSTVSLLIHDLIWISTFIRIRRKVQ